MDFIIKDYHRTKYLKKMQLRMQKKKRSKKKMTMRDLIYGGNPYKENYVVKSYTEKEKEELNNELNFI